MAKKRANGEGSIRRKPNGRWEGRYTQGIDPSTGRAIQKSVSARTQAECKEKLAKAIRDNRGIPVNHNEDYTVAEWCRLWFETYSKPVIRPSTAKTYENMIENHIVPAIGGVKLKRLTAIQIQQMYNDAKARGRVQRFETQASTALSGSTVRRIHMVLSSALKQAVKERIIPYNPCDNCRIPRKEHREMTIIPPEKLGVYLREAEKYGVLPMFFLELSSGLRRGELCALQWRDITGACEMTVRRSRSCASGQIVESDTKSHRERIVTIPLGLWELLMALRQQQMLHSGVPDREQPIFTDPDGHVPHPDTFTRHLRKLYKKCGLSEDYHLHTLRHFYATYLLQEGTSKQVAASLLGHADTAFLERTYCHPQDAVKLQAANLMQDLLNSQNPCYVAFMKNKNRKAKKAG